MFAQLFGSSLDSSLDDLKYSQREVYLQFQLRCDSNGQIQDASKVAVVSNIMDSKQYSSTSKHRYSAYVQAEQCPALSTGEEDPVHSEVTITPQALDSCPTTPLQVNNKILKIVRGRQYHSLESYNNLETDKDDEFQIVGKDFEETYEASSNVPKQVPLKASFLRPLASGSRARSEGVVQQRPVTQTSFSVGSLKRSVEKADNELPTLPLAISRLGPLKSGSRAKSDGVAPRKSLPRTMPRLAAPLRVSGRRSGSSRSPPPRSPFMNASCVDELMMSHSDHGPTNAGVSSQCRFQTRNGNNSNYGLQPLPLAACRLGPLKQASRARSDSFVGRKQSNELLSFSEHSKTHRRRNPRRTRHSHQDFSSRPSLSPPRDCSDDWLSSSDRSTSDRRQRARRSHNAQKAHKTRHSIDTPDSFAKAHMNRAGLSPPREYSADWLSQSEQSQATYRKHGRRRFGLSPPRDTSDDWLSQSERSGTCRKSHASRQYARQRRDEPQSASDLALAAANDLMKEVESLRAQVQAHEKAEEGLLMEVAALRNSLATRRKVLAGTGEGPRICVGSNAVEARIMSGRVQKRRRASIN